MLNRWFVIRWEQLIDYAATPTMWKDALKIVGVQLLGSLEPYSDYRLAFMELKGVDGPGEYVGQLWFDGMHWVFLNNSTENIMRLPRYPVLFPDVLAPKDTPVQVFPNTFSDLLFAIYSEYCNSCCDVREMCRELWKALPDDNKEDVIKLYRSHSHWSQHTSEDVTEDLQQEHDLIMKAENEINET